LVVGKFGEIIVFIKRLDHGRVDNRVRLWCFLEINRFKESDDPFPFGDIRFCAYLFRKVVKIRLGIIRPVPDIRIVVSESLLEDIVVEFGVEDCIRGEDLGGIDKFVKKLVVGEVG